MNKSHYLRKAIKNLSYHGLEVIKFLAYLRKLPAHLKVQRAYEA